MKKAFRIGYYRYINDDVFAEHIDFVKKNLENIDEIAIFVEFSHHGYWPIDQQRKHAELLRSRMEEYRKAGVKSVGINVLDTIGHLEEGWSVLAKPDMQTMVGFDGKVSNSCLCVNTDEYRNYIAERYKIIANSNPDFIWVDDDLRVDNHGVAGPCYCQNCIDKFNKISGRNESFESLTDDISDELNQLWNKFCIDSITEICDIIKDSIHEVNENIVIGLMTGAGCQCEWFESLGALMGRPGGGYYTDEFPRYIGQKFISCENQLDVYPKQVTDRQYEFENFPYQDLAKSNTISRLEALFALMTGCNGIAFNAVFFNNNQRIMDIVKQNKAQWEQIVKRCKNSVNIGGFCGTSIDTAADFLCAGMPMSGSAQAPCAYVLDGKLVSQKTDLELKEILSQNAFVTGDGFALIEKRGLAYLCGVNTSEIYTNGVYERFTDDEINGKFAGVMRNSYINFNGVLPQIATLSLQNGTRVLSELYNLLDKPLGPCFTAYENELGGRVAVSTYVYSCHFGYISKRAQILNTFDWLCKGLPVRIINDCRVAPILRQREDGGFLLMLSNMDFDAIENLQVEVITPATECVMLKADGNIEKANFSVLSGGKIRINIPRIEPWSAIIISDK